MNWRAERQLSGDHIHRIIGTHCLLKSTAIAEAAGIDQFPARDGAFVRHLVGPNSE